MEFITQSIRSYATALDQAPAGVALFAYPLTGLLGVFLVVFVMAAAYDFFSTVSGWIFGNKFRLARF